jgi:hypothetical protein
VKGETTRKGNEKRESPKKEKAQEEKKEEKEPIRNGKRKYKSG